MRFVLRFHFLPFSPFSSHFSPLLRPLWRENNGTGFICGWFVPFVLSLFFMITWNECSWIFVFILLLLFSLAVYLFLLFIFFPLFHPPSRLFLILTPFFSLHIYPFLSPFPVFAFVPPLTFRPPQKNSVSVYRKEGRGRKEGKMPQLPDTDEGTKCCQITAARKCWA